MPNIPRQLFSQDDNSERNSPESSSTTSTNNSDPAANNNMFEVPENPPVTDFDFEAERTKAVFILRSCRNDPNYTPTESEISEMVRFEYTQVRQSRTLATRPIPVPGEKRERDFAVEHSIEVHSKGAGDASLKGANPLCLVFEHKAPEVRLAIFERSIDELHQKTLAARIGVTSDDHVVVRHSALAYETLLMSGRLLLRTVKDPETNREWCEEAANWQHLFFAHLLAIKHNVPSQDAMKVLDYVHTANDFKVDRKLPRAKAIESYYSNYFNFANTSFPKWLNKVRTGALEREKADRSNSSRASKRNRAEFRETNKADNKPAQQKKWQGGGTSTRT